MKPNDDNDNDDDDVWCNPEDEDNLEHCVKIEQERLEQIREILGNETLQMICEAFEVSLKSFLEFIFNDLYIYIYFFLRKMNQILKY